MTERPILFSGAMVRALLAGRKTQTRRVVKPRPGLLAMTDHQWTTDQILANIPCPYGAPGDRLWVRETWAPCEAKARRGHFQYAADGAVGHEVATNGGERWWERSGHTMGVSDERLSGMWVSKPSRWRPSIHMPRWASRLTLEVTGVRVERLQDISEEDARAEGCVDREPEPKSEGGTIWYWPGRSSAPSFRANFCHLWESINGADSWAENPWVWVVEFKRVTP